MGTYNIPRNVKGEGRILFIFSTKSLIYSVIGAVAGLLFYFLFSMLKITLFILKLSLIEYKMVFTTSSRM